MSWTYRHRKALVIAVMAVGVGLLVAAAIFALIRQAEQAQKQEQMKEQYEKQIQQLNMAAELSQRNVWTVARTIPAGGAVTADDLLAVTMPESLVPPGVMTSRETIIGKSAKIELQPGTPLMPSLLYESTPIPKDWRVQEFQVIQLPSNLLKGQFIDVRINFPTGEDFVLLAKKKVRDVSGTAIWLEMNETDILQASSAIIDAYLQGARLYALPYIEPGLQEAALVNYPANPKVLDLMAHDPNLLEKATTELARKLRTTLDDNLKAMSESDKLRVTSGNVTVQQQLQNERIVTQQGNSMQGVTATQSTGNSGAATGQSGNTSSPTTPSYDSTTPPNAYTEKTSQQDGSPATNNRQQSNSSPADSSAVQPTPSPSTAEQGATSGAVTSTPAKDAASESAADKQKLEQIFNQ
ncbi:flagella basal body P-ring formation protein FlgA [Paenibacillus athensensis]|uniref:SAF domain-containing protein n=1 Tax=Paenibacillus athensensis TaxID=1967502 RepID=A0A4Y8Q221_9BACL|nr:SAF domain-containing protein [Paenibacillus athensensis]MCD1261333.1 flagella basal body P-ring formation protein FlgA [Paenibacillus athensensis]